MCQNIGLYGLFFDFSHDRVGHVFLDEFVEFSDSFTAYGSCFYEWTWEDSRQTPAGLLVHYLERWNTWTLPEARIHIISTRVIQSVTCKKPRFPKTAPKTISIIATDNPSRSEIKLAMKMMITSANKLNWVNKSIANDNSSEYFSAGVISL